jgi:murein DD-endopeptidase MepM/ murein hydrolase activator NlpD
MTLVIALGPGIRTLHLRIPLLLVVILVAASIAAGARGLWMNWSVTQKYLATQQDYLNALTAVEERDRLRERTAQQEAAVAELTAKAEAIEADLARIQSLEMRVNTLLGRGGVSEESTTPPAVNAEPDKDQPQGGPEGDPPVSRSSSAQGTSDPALDRTQSRLEIRALASAPDDLINRMNTLESATRSREDRLKTLSIDLSDRVDYLAHKPYGLPVPGEITSGYGWRPSPFTSQWQRHDGVDLATQYGTPVRATGAGVVVYAGWMVGGYGYTVQIDHGYGYATLYGHNASVAVNLGDQVGRGDVIARVGSSGASTGPHVHYEVILHGENVDPLDN